MPRKSTQVHLSIVASVAALAAACTSSETRCVDADNRVVPDSLCSTTAARPDSSHDAATRGYAGVFSPYHYYYGGWFWGRGGQGTRLIGGSTAGSNAHGVLRGGFGTTGATHGGAGGE